MLFHWLSRCDVCDGATRRGLTCRSGMSGAKDALKLARAALAAKEYKEALGHCKTALKADRNSYEAYL